MQFCWYTEQIAQAIIVIIARKTPREQNDLHMLVTEPTHLAVQLRSVALLFCAKCFPSVPVGVGIQTEHRDF